MPGVPVRDDRAEPDVGLQLRRDGGQVQAPAPVGRGGQVPELSAKEAEEEMRVYRYVTKDRYRLPVAQADSMGGADRAQLWNGSAGHGGRVPGAEDKRPL